MPGLVRDVSDAGPRDPLFTGVLGNDIVGKGVDGTAERFLIAEILPAQEPRAAGGIVELAGKHDLLPLRAHCCPGHAGKPERARPLDQLHGRLGGGRIADVELLGLHYIEYPGMPQIGLQDIERLAAERRGPLLVVDVVHGDGDPPGLSLDHAQVVLGADGSGRQEKQNQQDYV